eukprot:1155916-Pelagomonas_calceolata.AAC.9
MVNGRRVRSHLDSGVEEWKKRAVMTRVCCDENVLQVTWAVTLLWLRHFLSLTGQENMKDYLSRREQAWGCVY